MKKILNNPEYIDFLTKQLEDNNITRSVKALCKEYDLSYSDQMRRSFSKKLQSIGVIESNSIEESKEYHEATNRKIKKSKYYLVSWAQAQTEVHKPFLENMEAYAQHLGAEIAISAGRYKNPVSIERSARVVDSERNKNTWDSCIHEYLYASKLDLAPKLTVLANVKVQPTAVKPLSGLNGFTSDSSVILPHPKVQLESLPILDGYKHKLMLSTGAVTMPNYTDTKAGRKGEFHHQMGFVVVEIDKDNSFHVRQVQADDEGNFFDLFSEVRNGVVLEGKGDYSVVFGDLHIGSHCTESVSLACDIANRVEAKNVILHDVLDSKSINHHEEKNPFRLLEKEESGEDNLEEELEYTLLELKALTKRVKSATFHNIASNHNDFLDRWLRDVDWRKVRNKKMYLELANIVAKGKAPKGVFNYLVSDRIGNRVNTYAYGDSLRIKNWELALHGDYGANGSRGGINQFKNLSTKTITGHTHSPRREDGSIIVGTLTKLRIGYNTGLSSWMNGVVLIYPNGKATNIHFINNKYTIQS